MPTTSRQCAKPDRLTRLAPQLTTLALTLLTLSAPARALDYIWQGGGGFWDDASRWTLLGVPGSGDSATINFTGTGSLLVRDARSVGTLFFNGGNLASAAMLSVDTLRFNGGSFGSTAAQSGGVMNVNGAASFNGAGNQAIDYSHIVNLNGNSTWSAGNGQLFVSPAYTQGISYPAAQLNIAAGTTFTDAGAASASGVKTLGGGAVNNIGTYRREGLGETYAFGFNNSGTLDIASGNFVFASSNNTANSSGLIKVASGSTLLLLSHVNFTAGSVQNNGLVRQFGSGVVVGGNTVIGGAWQLDAGGTRFEGTHSVSSLVLGGALATGPGVLNTGTLTFTAGTFGGSGSQSGGTLNVSGNAMFNGASNQAIDYSHIVNLNGNASWSAGNGRLIVGSAYSQGNTAYPASQLNIAAGTTFTDAGAASATGFKTLGLGGAVNNNGTYRRQGLGETYAGGFNNNGTLDIASGNFSFASGNFSSSSSGVIKVASGSTLYLANVTFTAGSVQNNGLVQQYAGSVVVGSGAVIGGAWQVDAGSSRFEGTHNVASLVINGGLLTGPGVLSTGSLAFNGGTFGGSGSQSGGTLNVAGLASFNGASAMDLNYSHIVNLNGNAVWSAGNGRLIVGSAYSQGNTAYPASQLNIAAGTTFTDAGAASAAGFKTLGLGGAVNNNGIYRRQGLGETYAGGFNNIGTLDLAAGAMLVDAAFRNTGTVEIASGARLAATSGAFTNAGLMRGLGTVKTLNVNTALNNIGTLDPGLTNMPGTLTIDGNLVSDSTGRLRIDLFGAGIGDRLAVSGSALWLGDLDVFAAAGASFTLGETYVVASFAQRANNSVFDRVNFNGFTDTAFSVEYSAQTISLRVTAVPEPATWALALLSAPLLAAALRRRRQACAA